MVTTYLNYTYCNREEVEEIEYEVQKVNQTIWDSCTFPIKESNSVSVYDNNGNEAIAQVIIKQEKITYYNFIGVGVIQFDNNSNISEVNIDNKTINAQICNSDLYYKITKTISKKDLTIEWLGENALLVGVWYRGGGFDERFTEEELRNQIKKEPNYEYLEYKLGNYTIEVKK